MIKILHTIDTTGPGGAETVFVTLAKGLDSNRFQSLVAIPGPGKVCDMLRAKSIEPIFVRSQGSFNLPYLIELIKIIKKFNINIVHSHLFGANLYCSLAGLICRVPVISTFHGFVDTAGGERLKKAKFQIINSGSKKIVFVSNRLREHFIDQHGIMASKAITIYNGVDPSLFHPKKDDRVREKLSLGKDHILIGAVGNIRPAKGYEIFIKAAHLVIEHHPECRFVLAGQGSGILYDSLIKLRNDLKLEEKFFFLGFFEKPSIFLNNLDIFSLSSLSEGFSISTIEAMACNIPVIVTRSGGPEEIVLPNETGLMVEPGNESALAEAISLLIREEKLRERLSTSGRNSISDRFNIFNILNQYEELYLEMANPANQCLPI